MMTNLQGDASIASSGRLQHLQPALAAGSARRSYQQLHQRQHAGRGLLMGPRTSLSRQLCRISAILHSGRCCVTPVLRTPAEAHSIEVWAVARGQTSGTRASLLQHCATCRTAAACGHPDAVLAGSGVLTAAAAASLASLPAPSATQRRGRSSAVMPAQPPAHLPLEEPAETETVPPDAVPAVLRASHWITAQRGRSFEDRGLRVRVKARRGHLRAFCRNLRACIRLLCIANHQLLPKRVLH